MPNLTTITLSASGQVTSSGTFSTIDGSFGTAGTSNTNVASVQGISGGTPLIATGTLAISGTSNVALTGTGTVNVVASTTVTVVVSGTANVALTGTGNVSVVNANTNGRKTPANSAPVVLNSLTYTTVAASTATSLMGSSGAVGDYMDGILVVPTSVSPGSTQVVDSTTAVTVFAGGTTSLTNLVPFFIPIGVLSANGAWKVTTGSSLSTIVYGNFT